MKSIKKIKSKESSFNHH